MSHDQVVELGPYRLEPLEHIRCDDVAAFLGSRTGIYVCNAPTPAWHGRHKITQTQPSTMGKKRAMFAQMAPGSEWLSPTYVEGVCANTTDWQEGEILHIGYGKSMGRFAQLRQTRRLLRLLRERLNRHAYILTFNLPLPTSLASLALRLSHRTRLLLDFEDDYTLQRASRFKNLIEQGIRRCIDGAVCVNQSMQTVFPDTPTCVVNAFATAAAFPPGPLAEGARFLVSGSLDHIRGADLLPDLVRSLRRRLTSFHIDVTGDGPLRSLVESLSFPELTYHGLLDDDEYLRVLAASDICLVLQRPDHPFSRGSYPSKIQAFARQRKPVMVLRVPDGPSPW